MSERAELYRRRNQLDLQIDNVRRSANRARRPDRKSELETRLASLREDRDKLQQQLDDTGDC